MKNVSLSIIISFAFTTLVMAQEMEVDGTLRVTGGINAEGQPISNVGDPQNPSDAATMSSVENYFNNNQFELHYNIVSSSGSLEDNSISNSQLMYLNVEPNKLVKLSYKGVVSNERYTCSTGLYLYLKNDNDDPLTLISHVSSSVTASDCNLPASAELNYDGYVVSDSTGVIKLYYDVSIGGYNNYQQNGTSNYNIQAILFQVN